MNELTTNCNNLFNTRTGKDKKRAWNGIVRNKTRIPRRKHR